MESIAILKPNMGVLSQKRLALSPFGALAQEFAEELLARAKREEGAWSYVPLELLEEETAQPTPIQQTTVLQVDLKLVLEALKRETVRTEQLRATERIVERLLQRQKARQEKTVPSASAKPEAASHTPAPKPVTPFQQTLFQTIHQNIHFHLPEQNSLSFSGQSGVVRLTAPGQLGQRASEFSQALRVLREEGKSFAAEEREAAKNRAYSDKHRRPQELTFREDSEKETPIQSHSASEARLLRTAERLERVLSSEIQSQTHPEKQRTQTVPTAQAVGPKQENPLPEKAVLQKSASGSLHTTNQSNQALPKVGEHTIETTARQIGTETAQKSGPAARDIRTAAPKTLEGVQAEAGEASTQVQLAPAQEAAQVSAPLPGVELTYRTEEGKEQEEAIFPSKQPKRSAKSTLAEIKQSSSSETKSAPKSPESEMGQTAQAIPTAIPSTLEHIQKESGVQTQPVSAPGTIPAVQRMVEQNANASSEMEQPFSRAEQRTSQTATGRTVRDIRTVAPVTLDSNQAETGEAGTQAPSAPAQEMAQVSAPLPGVELTYRTEEGKEQEEAISLSKQPEQSAKSAPAETKQSSSSETKSAPKSPKSEMGQTAQAIRTAMPSTLEHIQKESGVQTPSATVPGTIPAVQKTVEQSAKALADIEQRSSGEEKHTSQTATGRTVRDIRTVTLKTPDGVQAEAGGAGTQAPSTPAQEAAQVSAPLPSVELTYRTEEGKEQEATSPSKQPERSAKSTLAETKQPSSSERKSVPKSPKSEMGRTAQEIRTAMPSTPEHIQKESGGQTQPVSAPRTIPAVQRTVERSAKASAETEQPSSRAEKRTSQTATGRTVRDIRTVAPATLDSIQAEAGKAGTQAPSVPVQEAAQVSAPLPGVDLTYRTEEGKEQEGTSQTGRPERSARSAPAETEQPSSSTERHTSQPATGQTVRDIRTVAPATLDSIQMETGKAGTQALSAPAQEAEEVSAPLPGVDLTYRTEEGKEQKEATSQTARLERSAKSAPVETEQSSSSTERRISQPATGQIVRDIRTVAPKTPEGVQAEVKEAGTQMPPAPAQKAAQMSAPLPGVELTYRAEELEESHRPAAEKGQVSSFQKRGGTQPRTEVGRTQPGRHVWKGTPHPTSTWTDIRVSRNLLHGAAPAFAPEGERLWKTAPESVPPQAELDYGGGQEHTPQPSTARGPFVQRPAPPDDAEEPVPLTYGPTAALVNQTPPPEPQSHSAPEESEFVRSLPDWARRFLRENAAGTEPQSMGVARNISALPEQPGEQIQWTAPNYQPTEPLAHREKQLEEPPRQAQPVRISEAEIQRTADRVYRMIEERIREDRIRLGR